MIKTLNLPDACCGSILANSRKYFQAFSDGRLFGYLNNPPIALANGPLLPKLSGHFHMYWNAILADTAAPATTPAVTTSTGTAPQPSPAQQFLGNPIIFLVLLVVMMYFIMIRPQQQRTKQMAKLLASVKAGDKVVTSSGIVGVVITVKDKTISLRSADAKMEVTKSSVTEILENSDANASSSQ
jgi:preprotein translocase subunit YajC